MSTKDLVVIMKQAQLEALLEYVTEHLSVNEMSGNPELVGAIEAMSKGLKLHYALFALDSRPVVVGTEPVRLDNSR